ncbi:MAG: hypothetical protein MMC23_000239 [Stictis urceolatum]|nr:hypothetical protein [Stictis urceolata]
MNTQPHTPASSASSEDPQIPTATTSSESLSPPFPAPTRCTRPDSSNSSSSIKFVRKRRAPPTLRQRIPNTAGVHYLFRLGEPFQLIPPPPPSVRCFLVRKRLPWYDPLGLPCPSYPRAHLGLTWKQAYFLPKRSNGDRISREVWREFKARYAVGFSQEELSLRFHYSREKWAELKLAEERLREQARDVPIQPDVRRVQEFLDENKAEETRS